MFRNFGEITENLSRKSTFPLENQYFLRKYFA